MRYILIILFCVCVSAQICTRSSITASYESYTNINGHECNGYTIFNTTYLYNTQVRVFNPLTMEYHTKPLEDIEENMYIESLTGFTKVLKICEPIKQVFGNLI